MFLAAGAILVHFQSARIITAVLLCGVVASLAFIACQGDNWTNRGHRFTVNSIIPLPWRLKLQVGGEFFLQDYANESSIPAFNKETRRDRTYTGMGGLTWDLNKNLSLMLQYTGIRANSNIFAYDFQRNIYSVGAELRF